MSRLETVLAQLIHELAAEVRAGQTDEQIGPRGLCPGIQVVLVSRVATIRRMLPYWNVEVELPDGQIETWWRGNLQLVLPAERTR